MAEVAAAVRQMTSPKAPCRLMSDRIPESNTNIRVARGTSPVENGVKAFERVNAQQHRRRPGGQAQTQTRSGLQAVAPLVTAHIGGQVEVPICLGCPWLKR